MPHDVWQLALDPATFELPLIFAGDPMIISTRCKFGRPGVRYSFNLCVRGPRRLRCRFSRRGRDWRNFEYPTVPRRATTSRVSWPRHPGAPVFMRVTFRTYTE